MSRPKKVDPLAISSDLQADLDALYKSRLAQGSSQDFLGLTDEEAAEVEKRVQALQVDPAQPEFPKAPPLTAKGLKQEEKLSDPKRLFRLKGYQKRIGEATHKGFTPKAQELIHRQTLSLQDAEAKTWVVEGKQVDRYEAMKWIVEQLSAGKTYREILAPNQFTRLPTMQTVYAWKAMHPDFGKALKRAKEIQAEVFADRALEIVLDEEVGKNAPLVKVKHDALMKRAALQSPEFREKAPAPPDPPNPDSLREQQQQLAELLRNNPQILTPELQDMLKMALQPAPAMNVELAPTQEDEEEPSGFAVAPPNYLPPVHWAEDKKDAP